MCNIFEISHSTTKILKIHYHYYLFKLTFYAGWNTVLTPLQEARVKEALQRDDSTIIGQAINLFGQFFIKFSTINCLNPKNKPKNQFINDEVYFYSSFISLLCSKYNLGY